MQLGQVQRLAGSSVALAGTLDDGEAKWRYIVRLAGDAMLCGWLRDMVYLCRHEVFI